MAAILSKQVKHYEGSLKFFDTELSDIREAGLLDRVTYLGAGSYLMSGTVKELLDFAKPGATEERMWAVLEQVNLKDFFETADGLHTVIESGGTNLSGGQRQRLSLAMALLKDSDVYIFDEVTSNIDVESEEHIVSELYKLAGEKLVFFISHRLANIKNAHVIYVLNRGELKEKGTHDQLVAMNGIYESLWAKQVALEAYRGEGDHA